MFKKFVLITGALDFPIGLAVAVPAVLDPQPGNFTALVTLGAFLCFAAAALMWSAQDLQTRAPPRGPWAPQGAQGSEPSPWPCGHVFPQKMHMF